MSLKTKGYTNREFYLVIFTTDPQEYNVYFLAKTRLVIDVQK